MPTEIEVAPITIAEVVAATVNSAEAMVAVTSVEATVVAIEEAMEAIRLAVDMAEIEEAMEAIHLAADMVEIEEAMVIEVLVNSRAKTLASWATSVLTLTNVKLR